jgi:hypothetical protein
MIDDRQTCDVCGEEFNEERMHDHAQPEKLQDAQAGQSTSQAKETGEGAIVDSSHS